ncbi:MAG: flagellin FliC [Methylococcales bacterium]|jgi:flagellin|nr:flagellin FliC [Methylococcales bacterium]
MALVVNSNIFSANAQRNLSRSSGDLQTSLQRLSSGLRINSAKDDAAGQFSVETLTADIRGVNQAIRNAGDGISLAQTAEGALGQITNNLQRVRELAVQSASGTIEDRTGLQAEVDQLTQEVSRIVATTNFNGVSLLSAAGAGSALTFQIGQDGNTNNQVTVQLTAGTGSISSVAGVTTNLTGTNTVAISTAAAASAALVGLDTAINTLSQKRAVFGAVQNRFEAVISNLSNFSENLSAARSRIQDADFAYETAKLTRAQILQQAGISILSQANQIPNQALSLLQ